MSRPVLRSQVPPLIIVCLLGALSQARIAASDEANAQRASPPPKRLSDADARRVKELKTRIELLWRGGKFDEAVTPAGEIVATCGRALGPDHWRTGDARRALKNLETIAGLSDQGRGAMASVRALEERWNQLRASARDADAERVARELIAIQERWLGADHPAMVDAYNHLAINRERQGQFVEAEALFRKALSIQLDATGLDHPDTAAIFNNLAANLEYQRRHLEAEPLHRNALAIRLMTLGEDHPDTATSYDNLAAHLHSQRRYAEAEPLCRKALAIRLKTQGPKHPRIATTEENLAILLEAQGRHVEAEPLYRGALAIRLETQREGHPDTARSYDYLGGNLSVQGKFAEAEEVRRRGLGLSLRARGEEHPDTARIRDHLAEVLIERGKYPEAEEQCRRSLQTHRTALGSDHMRTGLSHNGLATVLVAQGRYALAEEHYRRALAIVLNARGEGDINTAIFRSNLAAVLRAQGRYAEAEACYRRALAFCLTVLGEGDRYTAMSRNNLAGVLVDLKRYAEAEEQLRGALAVCLTVLGEDSPRTSLTRSNLADVLKDQARYAEAEEEQRKALATCQKVFGERHPDTASNRNLLGLILQARGKYARAEEQHRLALDARLALLGGDHLDTVNSRQDLADVLDTQGKLVEATGLWEAASRAFERTRRVTTSPGIERSVIAHESPLTSLAVALARRGQPRAAFGWWEADLARGLLDEVSARQSRPLTDEEQRQEADLIGRLQKLDERIGRLAARSDRTRDEDKQLEELRRDQNASRGQLVAFENRIDAKYRAFAGAPSSLEAIQSALPADAALVGWADTKRHHWACIVRREGDPAWVPIPGTGDGQRWTEADDRRPSDLRSALAGNEPIWRDLAARLARQRLDPIRSHLTGVKRLIVLPSPALAGVPIETLLAAWTADAGRLVVSYAPSGSMFARLVQPRRADPGPPRLLALGDPAFAPRRPAAPPPPPPDHGLAIKAVTPLGNADLHGIRTGDVLLEYDGQSLNKDGDLRIVPAEGGARSVPITFWRNGEVRETTVAAGLLGIQFHPDRSTREVVLARRAAAEVLEPLTRGDAWERLEGTRREVQSIARLFPADRLDVRLGERATEAAVQALAARGELARYRFLHFATHGQADMTIAMNSSLILAPDPERLDPDRAGPDSAPETDGRITAQQIARTWKLDADLVVLSACQTGLGRSAGGEGYLGFSQALFARGARSIVLSLWKVDDNATALLMNRFYENLLGKRADHQVPMPKAEALHEAKRYLRDLSMAEKEAALAARDRGEVHRVDARPVPAGQRPYAHPKHWAAFILIGDPK